MIEPINSLLAESIFDANSLFDDVRSDLFSSILRASQLQPNAIPAMVQSAFAPTRAVLADHLAATAMSSWVFGVDAIERLFPEWLRDEFRTGIRSDFNPPMDGWFDDLEDQGPEPKPRFTIIENAINRLFERNVLRRDQWDRASAVARQNAFMITGDIEQDAISDVRDALLDDLRDGTSLDSFRDRAGDILKSSGLSNNRIETIYRTNVQSAFRDGRETIARDPLVMEAFPYQAYLAIHDARVRSSHLALESLGLSGTNVFRRDDPFWDYWTPPNGFNCRCGVRLMTVEAAARAGVEEAMKWLESGRPPANPEFRLQFIPFPPEEGFGFRGRFGSMVA